MDDPSRARIAAASLQFTNRDNMCVCVFINFFKRLMDNTLHFTMAPEFGNELFISEIRKLYGTYQMAK